MSIVAENEHVVVEERAADRVIIVHRTASRPETPQELRAAFADALGLAERYAGWGLVIDSRRAPGRNDPKFEKVLDQLRAEASARFVGSPSWCRRPSASSRSAGCSTTTTSAGT